MKGSDRERARRAIGEKTLTEQPCRELTDREVAALLAGLLSAVVAHTPPATVWRAFDHVNAYRDDYERLWAMLSSKAPSP